MRLAEMVGSRGNDWHFMKSPSGNHIQVPQLPKRLRSTSLARLEDHAEYATLAASGGELSHQAAASVLFEQDRFQRMVLAGTRLSKLRLIDTRLDACDLSSADWEKAHIRRAEFIGCRLWGASLLEAWVEDTLFKDCNGEGALFASATFRAVRFEHCTLRTASFAQADLTGTVLHKCDLSQADLRGAKLNGADLRGSTLEGAQVSPQELRGAIIEPWQAIQIANILGLVVRDDEEALS